MIQHKFGLYEKALPRDLALSEKLRIAKELGFDYFELSTDESDAFQARVASGKTEIIEIRKAIEAYDIPIMTMCLSGTRELPIGSENPELAAKGMKLTMDAIHFSPKLVFASFSLWHTTSITILATKKHMRFSLKIWQSSHRKQLPAVSC